MHPLCHDILHLIHCQIEKGPFDFFCFSQNTRYPIFIYTLKLTKKQENREKVCIKRGKIRILRESGKVVE